MSTEQIPGAVAGERPLRVALTHTRLSYTGGIEKYIWSLLERLLAAGHEVHYIADRFEPLDHPGLTLHRARMQRFPKLARVRSFNRMVNRVLDGLDVDLVHGFSKTDRQDIYTDGSGTLIEYLEATEPELPGWRRRAMLRSPHRRAILAMESARFQRGACRKVIPMAEFVRRQILARYPIEPERVETVHNGVELEVFHPRWRETVGAKFREEHRIGPETPVLLNVGNDWRRKGVGPLIEALPRIESPVAPPVLLIAGHDNHPERYHARAAELGVSERVRFLGPVREIRDVFAAADLFVFPTRYDVFGNVGLEALASGVPSLLSSLAGVSEVLDGTAGGAAIEDPSDVGEIAARSTEFLQPERLAERRAAARTLAERYSWDAHFERILAIYREVVAEKEAERTPEEVGS
ncbi:MAG: glycosyltransferase family 4 protein [Planctomycetota bacterium]